MNYREKLRQMIIERNELILQKDKAPKYLKDQLAISIKIKEEQIKKLNKQGGIMNSWIKEGLISGLQAMFFFILVSSIWALIIMISNNLGISPGWSMLTFFIIAIFSMSFASAKAKYDLEQKYGGKE